MMESLTEQGLTVFMTSPAVIERLRELAPDTFQVGHLSSGRVYYQSGTVRLFPMSNLPNRIFRLTGATYQTVLDAVRGNGDGA